MGGDAAPFSRAWSGPDHEQAADRGPGRGAPAGFARTFTSSWARPDIAYLPVTDLEPLPYALVWRREAESEPIRALAGIIRDLGPLPALDVVRHPRVGSDAKRAGCCLAVRQFALSPTGR
ncbi:hypothetical protein Ssi02_67300 [Sinosporangium siamense]|uniref:LysR substrate binding domain-containing protein n=1 Tax=Sinosporangium siamense TaxID=1367973 RepID=A0A919VFV9_9ACTN|nr:hypothetical protein Ssi02_67300 [Sinosporangium siamense]